MAILGWHRIFTMLHGLIYHGKMETSGPFFGWYFYETRLTISRVGWL